MATDKMEITVNVDETISDALADMARTVYKQTGLRIQHVRFDWISTPTVDKPGYFLKDVTVTSSGSGKP